MAIMALGLTELYLRTKTLNVKVTQAPAREAEAVPLLP